MVNTKSAVHAKSGKFPKTSGRVSSEVPNTKKINFESMRLKADAFIVLRCLDPLIKTTNMSDLLTNLHKVQLSREMSTMKFAVVKNKTVG